ncbi:queuosine precursor transporter [Brachybacterium subflavum]|uniref:queuosine precursor transporter n=1 Tax=Brachybacterium subflavum TaxID=2585206 RepID=UPI00126637CB|nr:queuosine precursor transporter [Brachybacterium subflavum]
MSTAPTPRAESAQTPQRPERSGRPAGVAYADRGSSHYDILAMIMCAVVILSGIGAAKGVFFGTIPGIGFDIITDGRFFLFPLAYIVGDIITELYGVRAARRAIIMGFVVNILAAICYQVIIALPPFPDDYGLAKQEAIETALGPVWIVVLAGLVGFAAGQSVNSLIMSRMKRRAGERGLIGRLFSASGAGELVDTILFCTIAAAAIGITGVGDWAEYTVLGFVYKVAVQYAVIPITAAVIRFLKRVDPTYQAALAAAS